MLKKCETSGFELGGELLPVRLTMKSVLPLQFWNEDVSSARSLEGVAHALPTQPPPLWLATGTRFPRSQQLLLLQRLLWIPCTPSYVVDAETTADWFLTERWRR